MAKKTKKTIKKITKKIASLAIRRRGGKKVVAKKVIIPVQPLGNRALIRPFTKDELEKKNVFGIILPGSDKKEKAEQGTVLAVGPGSYQDGKFVQPSVNAGDIVAFSKYGYDDIMVDGEELYLIKEENLLAILNK